MTVDHYDGTEPRRLTEPEIMALWSMLGDKSDLTGPVRFAEVFASLREWIRAQLPHTDVHERRP